MRKGIVLIITVLIALEASGESLNERLKPGYAKLRSGDIEGAITVFRDVQTDAPESELVKYSLGKALYQRAVSDLEMDASKDAVKQFDEARGTFEELAASSNPFVRENARFSAANCLAQVAKASAEQGDHERTVEAFKESIKAYEDVLRRDPDHGAARTNLNHMRYLLKTMLQNPPEKQPQQGEKSSEGQEDQQQQEQEGEEGEQGDPSEDQEQGEQESETEGEDEKEQQSAQERQQGESEQEDQNQEQAQQEGSETAAQEAQQDGEQQPEEMNRKNIEAILEALEEIAQKEQEQMRRAKEPPRVRGGKWW